MPVYDLSSIQSQLAAGIKANAKAAGMDDFKPLGGYIEGQERFDKTADPTDSLPGMPPNLGQFVLPHVTTFVGLTGSFAKVYRPSDEALKNSRENARYMRNDPVVMECVELRQRAVALLDWHLEPENPKDSSQQDLVSKLTKIVERIPRFMQYRENLLHATWFGRYGIQNRWRWKRIQQAMRLTVDDWLPVHGDKLVWRYDDGHGNYRPDQVGIRVGAALFGGNVLGKWSPEQMQKVEATEYGMAYFLDQWERPLLSTHRHFIEDGEWEEPWNAGRIHGHGIRSRLYWIWFQKQETLAYLMEYLERSAAGFEIWYYPMHNPTAEAAVRKAAVERSELGRNVILVPRPVGEDASAYNVERIEPGMAGVDQLKSLVDDYFGHQIKRYILGQTLTTEADATGLGSGLAEVHLETFMGLVRYDAILLEETITNELIEPIKQYNFPDAANIHIAFKIDTEQSDSQAKLDAFNSAFQMGLSIRGEDVRDIIGATKPEGDDEVLSQVALQKQMSEVESESQAKMAAMGGGPGGPGIPGGGGIPGDGDGDGVPNEDGEDNAEVPVARMSAAAKPVEVNGIRPAGRDGDGERSLLEASRGGRMEYRRYGGRLKKRAIYSRVPRII